MKPKIIAVTFLILTFMAGTSTAAAQWKYYATNSHGASYYYAAGARNNESDLFIIDVRKTYPQKNAIDDIGISGGGAIADTEFGLDCVNFRYILRKITLYTDKGEEITSGDIEGRFQLVAPSSPHEALFTAVCG